MLPGDIVRAVTAYRQILAGAPMWQQAPQPRNRRPRPPTRCPQRHCPLPTAAARSRRPCRRPPAHPATRCAQLASYTPVGKLETKRLIFRTEGATFADVRGAIASHREDDGGNGVVTLVLERAVSASTPLNQTRDTEPPRLEPLSDVILRDLKKKRVEDDLTKQVEGMSAAERTQRLLDLGFDVPPPDPEE